MFDPFRVMVCLALVTVGALPTAIQSHAFDVT